MVIKNALFFRDKKLFKEIRNGNFQRFFKKKLTAKTLISLRGKMIFIGFGQCKPK